MRTYEYGTSQTHVPAFLTKLWKLVTDTACDDLISWSIAGTSFIIYDEIRFSKELLPMYFKHNNMASFVRQLNMYGFRKLSCIDQGGMHCYKNEIEFYHQYFIKGQETLLELIKRKIPNSKTDEPKVKQEYINELISNIKSLRGKQDNAEQGLRSLRRENRILWRHVNLLTDRYAKQQAVLHQLLPFFVNMMRSSREVALKRKAPLMIDEGDVRAKMARTSPLYFVENNDQDSNHGLPSSPGNVSNRGPVIRDVTEMEGNKMFTGDILCSPNTSTAKECEVIVDSPLSSSLESTEQTIDSPYTDTGSMETLNILNCTFESSNSVSPHMEMANSPATVPSSPLQIQSQNHTLPTVGASLSGYSTISSGILPTPVIDESTSDVPLSPDIMKTVFLPKMENPCPENRVYTLDSLINNGVSSSHINNGIANNMSGFTQSSRPAETDLGWLLNQEAYGDDPNIENWLGQIFKSDNLVAGCSLPQEQIENI